MRICIGFSVIKICLSAHAVEFSVFLQRNFISKLSIGSTRWCWSEKVLRSVDSSNLNRLTSLIHWLADNVVSRILAMENPRMTSAKLNVTDCEYCCGSSVRSRMCSKRTRSSPSFQGSRVRRFTFCGSERPNPENYKDV